MGEGDVQTFSSQHVGKYTRKRKNICLEDFKFFMKIKKE